MNQWKIPTTLKYTKQVVAHYCGVSLEDVAVDDYLICQVFDNSPIELEVTEHKKSQRTIERGYSMIYTEPVTVEELIQRIEKKNNLGITKNILIAGCSICANISCSFYRGGTEPAMSLFLKPVAIEKEIEWISSKLKEKYNSVDSVTIMGLCGAGARTMRKITSKAKDADTIIVMSCPGGFKAVESYLDHRKLIMGMRVKGFKALRMKFKANGIYFG